MRSRVLAIVVAVVAIQAVGCSRLCRCCSWRDNLRNDRIPPAALNEKPLPPPTNPAASARPTGAYGGSGGE